jgi:hypothetical protein
MRTHLPNACLLSDLQYCLTNELKVQGSHFEASCAGVFRDAVCVAQEETPGGPGTLLKFEQLPIRLDQSNSATRNLTQSI